MSSPSGSFLCPACGDEFAPSRRAAHEQHWCPLRATGARGGDNDDSDDSDSDGDGGDERVLLTSFSSAGFHNTMTSSVAAAAAAAGSCASEEQDQEQEGVSIPQQWSSGLVEVNLAATTAASATASASSPLHLSFAQQNIFGTLSTG